MSYHVARVLPHTQPMRRFANAQSVWARQLRTAIPMETFPYNARNGRAIGNYAPLPFPLGGLGYDSHAGTRTEAPKPVKRFPPPAKMKPLSGFVNPGSGYRVSPNRQMMFRGRLVPVMGLGSTLVVI